MEILKKYRKQVKVPQKCVLVRCQCGKEYEMPESSYHEKKMCRNCRNHDANATKYIFSINGEKLTLSDISKKYGISYGTLLQRVYTGKTDIESLTSIPFRGKARFHVFYKGKKLSLIGLAKEVGCTKQNLYFKRKYGLLNEYLSSIGATIC